MDSFKKFSEDKLPDKCNFFNSLKESNIVIKNMKEQLIFRKYLK